ncbi:MAG: MarC family protein [Elusimicrobiota bacterium]|jgi:multiple antibiotic resistance protein|nr:MarC family protein [Elusimicrobiota bacterium]
MSINFSLVLSFFIALLAILNPIGNVPIFLENVNNESNAIQKNLAKLLALTIFVISIFFYYAGQPFLNLFGITIPAFKIAGGILIMGVGMRMLHGKPKFENEGLHTQKDSNNAFREATKKLSNIIVPVAIPIFLGPGAMTTVILYSNQAKGFLTNFFMILALAAVCTIIGAILYLSRWFIKILGINGMQIVTRTMGLILCAIAVQFVINGVDQLIPNLINPEFVHNIKS